MGVVAHGSQLPAASPLRARGAVAHPPPPADQRRSSSHQAGRLAGEEANTVFFLPEEPRTAHGVPALVPTLILEQGLPSLWLAFPFHRELFELLRWSAPFHATPFQEPPTFYSPFPGQQGLPGFPAAQGLAPSLPITQQCFLIVWIQKSSPNSMVGTWS